MDRVKILLYCCKRSEDNPYYCDNGRLLSLLNVISKIREEYDARLLRIGGGHRTKLPHNCEAELSISSAHWQTLLTDLPRMTEGTPVLWEGGDSYVDA